MDKIKIRFEKMTLKKAMILIFIVTVCLICALSSSAVFFFSHTQRELLDHRPIRIKNSGISSQMREDGSYNVYVDNSQVELLPLAGRQKVLYIGCYAGMIGLPVLFILTGIVMGSKIYYKLKIKKPVDELNRAIQNISDKDLDFTINCSSTDELGKLCSSMELMRAQLLESNKKQWDLMQQRKLLNESCAHDLRTPITVIRGYLDYMERANNNGMLVSDDISETISDMKEAAVRMESYVDCLRDIERLDRIPVNAGSTEVVQLIKEIRNTAENLNTSLKITVSENCKCRVICTDKLLLERIIENLVSNSVRYANDEIRIELSDDNTYLIVIVADDGTGFSNTDIDKAVTPFYSSSKDSAHFGIGLSICRILSEKLGGDLLIANNKNGGASVRVRIKK
ncbi:MAG: HAMP domain-containing sensor histidine kinase [Oscillospiraceae bacterium]|nr:HAMP domain-containing sensor histidine kinase [Oscillospiraceae bacterium]